MFSKLSFTSGPLPSWGRSSGTPALVRVLLRAWAHPQMVTSNMPCSASCLFHLRYPRDLSMLAYIPSYRCIVSYSTTSNPFYGHSLCAVLSPLSSVQFFSTSWTVAHQALLSMGILQARILEWVAMPSSRGSSQPRHQTQVSHIAGRLFTIWTTREALKNI